MSVGRSVADFGDRNKLHLSPKILKTVREIPENGIRERIVEEVSLW
jgi:hypothetical protein